MYTLKLIRSFLITIVMVSMLIIYNSGDAREYKLSERTIRRFKEFRELQADMQQIQTIGTILITIAPFRGLLDGLDPIDIIEISQEPWELIGTAAKGLSSNYKSQLRFFCQSEALSQHKSRDDFEFWLNLEKQFQ